MNVFYLEFEGEYTGINSAEVSHVNGRGTTFTIHMRNGEKISVSSNNLTVKQFIDAWQTAFSGDKP